MGEWNHGMVGWMAAAEWEHACTGAWGLMAMQIMM